MISECFDAIDGENVSLDLRKISESKVEIEQLWSETVRGAGHGGTALRGVVSLADKHDIELSLTPTRLLYDENQRGDEYTDLMDDLNKQALSNAQLVEWYARHGFEPTGGMGRRSPLDAQIAKACGDAGSILNRNDTMADNEGALARIDRWTKMAEPECWRSDMAASCASSTPRMVSGASLAPIRGASLRPSPPCRISSIRRSSSSNAPRSTTAAPMRTSCSRTTHRSRLGARPTSAWNHPIPPIPPCC